MQSSFYCLKRVRIAGVVQILRKAYQLSCPVHEDVLTGRTMRDTRESFGREAKHAIEETDSNYTHSRECVSVIKFQKMQSPGPSKFRRVFFRLADALVVAAKKTDENDTFSTFAYEQTDGSRRFVVAHPEMYWWDYIHKPPQHRHSYEVLPEGSPCWLYLDLEFPTRLNPASEGSRMTNTLIDILCAYMLVHCGIHCNKTNVVNLDSTTSEKFSRHLIFSIKDVAFKDNSHIGRFVKFVCAEIERFLKSNDLRHDILSYFERAHLEELFIDTDRGKKLFVDTAVYTRNRTFRVYKSTKWGKRSYLTVCRDSKHIPLRNYEDKELGIFLDSLISYFPNKKDLITVVFGNDPVANFKTTCNDGLGWASSVHYGELSPYPELDRFVAQMIYPGKVRGVNGFSSGIFVYYITGNRYCENIGRWHKSNNIFWVVDLVKKIMYQKCHDSECSGFRSRPTCIPSEINFYLKEKEEKDLLRSCAALVEEYTQWDLSSYGDLS